MLSVIIKSTSVIDTLEYIKIGTFVFAGTLSFCPLREVSVEAGFNVLGTEVSKPFKIWSNMNFENAFKIKRLPTLSITNG